MMVETLTSKQPPSRLKRPLQIALRRLSKHVDLDLVRLVERLEAHESLHEEGLGVLHVEVEEAHHCDGG